MLDMLCYAFVICLRLHYIRFTVVRAIISLFELHVNSSITFVSFEHMLEIISTVERIPNARCICEFRLTKAK